MIEYNGFFSEILFKYLPKNTSWLIYDERNGNLLIRYSKVRILRFDVGRCHQNNWIALALILDCFSKGILFRTHEENTITPLAVEVAKEMFLDGYYKAIAFGDGNCQKCAKCNPERCNFPGQTVPSMEACGMDVFATVRNNGLEIHTLRVKGEPQNHFGLILVE